MKKKKLKLKLKIGDMFVLTKGVYKGAIGEIIKSGRGFRSDWEVKLINVYVPGETGVINEDCMKKIN